MQKDLCPVYSQGSQKTQTWTENLRSVSVSKSVILISIQFSQFGNPHKNFCQLRNRSIPDKVEKEKELLM